MTISTIVSDVTSVFEALAPVVDVLDPAISSAISLVSKILAGVSAAEPTAIGLYQSLTSSVPPTAEQLQAYAASYEAAYQKLNTDLGEPAPQVADAPQPAA